METFGSGIVSDTNLTQAVLDVFDLKPKNIIDHLDLKTPIYRDLAAYGHFGRGEKYKWELIDKVAELKQKVK